MLAWVCGAGPRARVHALRVPVPARDRLVTGSRASSATHLKSWPLSYHFLLPQVRGEALEAARSAVATLALAAEEPFDIEPASDTDSDSVSDINADEPDSDFDMEAQADTDAGDLADRRELAATATKCPTPNNPDSMSLYKPGGGTTKYGDVYVTQQNTTHIAVRVVLYPQYAFAPLESTAKNVRMDALTTTSPSSTWCSTQGANVQPGSFPFLHLVDSSISTWEFAVSVPTTLGCSGNLANRNSLRTWVVL